MGVIQWLIFLQPLDESALFEFKLFSGILYANKNKYEIKYII